MLGRTDIRARLSRNGASSSRLATFPRLRNPRRWELAGPFTVKPPKFLRFVRHAIRPVEREHAPAKIITRNYLPKNGNLDRPEKPKY